MKWHIGWGLTQRCNLKCMHCYNASGKPSKQELSFDEAKAIADRLVDNGVRTINYGTGESSLLPYFWDLVEYVSGKGIPQGLTTSGYSVNEKTIGKVKKYMNDVDVSLDFPEPDKHNGFRGNRKAWTWAINALELLKKHDVSFSIVTCISAMNASTEIVDDFLKMCKEYGCEWRINWYKPTGRGLTNDGLKLQPQKVYEITQHVLENANILAMPDPLFAALLKIPGREGCPCGKTSFRITPNGKVVPCVYLTKEKNVDSLTDVDFDSVKRSSLFSDINNRKLDDCKGCDHFSICQGGCATRAYLEYGTMDASDAFCYKKIGLEKNPFENIKFQYAPKSMKVHEDYLCTFIVEPK